MTATTRKLPAIPDSPAVTTAIRHCDLMRTLHGRRSPQYRLALIAFTRTF